MSVRSAIRTDSSRGELGPGDRASPQTTFVWALVFQRDDIGAVPPFIGRRIVASACLLAKTFAVPSGEAYRLRLNGSDLPAMLLENGDLADTKGRHFFS